MRKGIDCKNNKWEEIELYGKMVDISGKKFTKLTALFPVVTENKRPQWLCVCECGNETVVACNRLTNQNTKSCGCLQKQKSVLRWDNYRKGQDTIGKSFGRLTAIEYCGIKNNEAIYKFQCTCGNTVIKSLHSVKTRNTNSCGCVVSDAMKKRIKSLIGQRFGLLIVEKYIGVDQNGSTTFNCLCDCGGQIVVSRSSLITHNTKSCGCISSIGQNNIKNILDTNKILYKPEYTFSDLIADKNKPLRYDFGILNETGDVVRLVEFDGPQHYCAYEYFGGEEKFLKTQANDTLKNQYALSHNIPLVRIPYYKRDDIRYEDIFEDKFLIKGDF